MLVISNIAGKHDLASAIEVTFPFGSISDHLNIAGGHANRYTFAQQGVRDCPSDSLRPTGDDRDFVFEIHLPTRLRRLMCGKALPSVPLPSVALIRGAASNQQKRINSLLPVRRSLTAYRVAKPQD
jgi:hypothetical protein